MQLSELAFFTDDVPGLADFYERLLGVAPIHRGDGIAIFHTAGVQVLIHKRYVPGPGELPCENHVAFSMPDVDQAAAELTARGLTLEVSPREFDWGRSAYLRDPAGALIEIQQERTTRQGGHSRPPS